MQFQGDLKEDISQPHIAIMKARIEDAVVYSPYPKVDIPICSVYSAISKFLSMRPEKLAVVDEQISLTRGEFLVRMKRYAAGFQAHGLGPEHRVAVHLGNSAENLTALFALTFTGASVILCNPVLNQDELLFQMSDGGASHAFTSSQLAPKVLAVSSKLQLKKNHGSALLLVWYDWPRKRHEISHYSFVANLHMTGSVLTYEEKENDVLLAWYPLTYASGFLFTIVARASAPPASRDDTGECADPPSLLLVRYGADGHGPPSVRKLNVGGTVLTCSLADRLRAAFPGLRCLRNLYGMSESCSVLCSPPTDEISAANIGFPAPMVELKVRNLIWNARWFQ
ncbi:uncharacterized protein LOC119397140 [Rhipicephalus sanguineus]|uniref:uncharacterized protein LOC119397140 n=1 Tax=Rhipicephalus sanguineus TaxID=34632 RepID=UPI0020C31352|nr:uncharacterized protein LOC119397140 [Rhipicephalus sanguineus]